MSDDEIMDTGSPPSFNVKVTKRKNDEWEWLIETGYVPELYYNNKEYWRQTAKGARDMLAHLSKSGYMVSPCDVATLEKAMVKIVKEKPEYRHVRRRIQDAKLPT